MHGKRGILSSIYRMWITGRKNSGRENGIARTSDRRRDIDVMCLPPVFVVEAKGAGRGRATTRPSVARRGPVNLGVRIRRLHLVEIRPDLLEVEGNFVSDPIRPRRHEAVEGRVVGLDHLAHQLEK